MQVKYKINSFINKAELHHHINKVEKESYKKFCSDLDSSINAGAKQFIWRSMEDERTCKKCQSMDGKKFNLSDVKQLKQFYKHHGQGGCRCFVQPLF